jgi:hypothetical protein
MAGDTVNVFNDLHNLHNPRQLISIAMQGVSKYPWDKDTLFPRVSVSF